MTVHVNASRTSALTNTGQVTTTTSDPTPGNNSATQGTAVATSADLSLTKTDSADPVGVGANLTYTLTAANAGPSDAVSVSVSDPLPAGVTYVSATPSQGTCSQAAGTVTCSLGTIASGANASIAVVVTANVDGTLTNTASVSSTTTDPNGSNNGATQGTTVDPLVDLSLTKTDSVDPVTAGTNLTYTLTATNAGPSVAHNVSITDAVPAGTSFVSASGGGTLAAGMVTWSIGDLASGANVSRTLTVHVNAGRTAPLSNTGSATTTTTDTNGANNSATQATAVATSADLSLTKTDSTDPIAVGNNLTYTLTVSNAGPSDATSVVLTDPLPAGITYVSATPSQGTCSQAAGTVTCPLGTIASGANATVSVVVTPTTDGTLTNTASVSSATTDPNGGNNGASETTDVTPIADLQLSKDDGVAVVVAGTSTTYTLTLTNTGPSMVPAGVEITDAIPAGVSASESEADCDIAAGTLTCTTTAGLAVGASVSFDLDVDVDADYSGLTLSNTATITSSPYADTDGSDDSSTDVDLVDTSADLGVTIGDAPDPVVLGNDVTYTISISNAGSSDAHSVVAAVPLPVGLVFVSADPGCTYAAGVVTCSLPSLAAGGSAAFDIVTTPTVAGGLSVPVGVASAIADPNGANDADTELTTVTASADLSLTKTDDVDPVAVGSDLTYTLTVHNAGPSDAQSVDVTDVLPGSVTYVSATPSQGTCSETLGTVSCSLGIVLSGSDATIDVVVTPTTDGSFTNTASVTTSTSDPDPSNDDASEDTDVTPVADLELTKDDGLATVVAGTSTTYTLTLTNTGPNPVPAGVQITDSIPAGVSASESEGDCDIVAGTLTCTTTAGLPVGASVNYDLDVDVDADYAGPTLSNTGMISSSPYVDPDAANDQATDVDLVGTVADLGVTIDDDFDPVVLGSDITYTITVDNAGPSDAQNVTADAALPAGLVFVSADPACGFAAGVVTCSIPSLAAGAQISFDVTVSPSAAGTVTLPVTVDSGTIDPNAANDTDSEDTLVLAPPVTDADLGVTIDDVSDPVQVGAPLSYTITVTNAGPADAAAVEVVQVLPAGSVFVAATPSQGSCSEVAGTVTCLLGAIPLGGSATIDVDTTAPSTAGTATSPVQVSSGSPDPVGGNDADSEDTQVLAIVAADLSLVKDDGTAIVTAGGWTTYTLTIHNAGPDDAPAGVVVTDPVPSGTTMTETEGDCDVAAGLLTCTTSSTIAMGADLIYTVDVTLPSGFSDPTLSNTAQIASSPLVDPDASNDDSTDLDDVITRADLSIGVSDTPDPVVLGNDVTYTMTVTNAGPSDAAAVSASSVLPAGATFVSADPACAVALGTVICSAGSLAPGASASFDVVLNPTAMGVLTFDAFVTSTTTDTNALNDTDSEPTDVVAAPPTDVDLDGRPRGHARPRGRGPDALVQPRRLNAGPADAAGVEISEQLPAGVTFVSASAGCTEAAGVVTCVVGALNNGASANRNVVVTAPTSVTPLSASAFVTTTSVDTNPANDTSVEPTAMVAAPPGPASADLGVTVTDTPDPVNAGDTVTYSIQISNAGPDDATNSVLTFTLPPGATFTSATPLQGTCSQAGGVVTCPLGTIATGGSTSVSVVVALTLEGSATATALVATDVTDPVVANNSATAVTTVNAVADLSLTKDDGVTSVVPGTSTTYTLTLANAGPSSAGAGVTVVDHLPAGTTAHVTDPNCVLAGNDVTCTTTAPLASGSSVSWQITVDIPADYAGATLDNSASISSSPTTDPHPANDDASDQDQVTPSADLSIVKVDHPDPVHAGQRITYTITVTNNGPGTAEDVVITDPVPAASEIEEILDGGTQSGGIVTWNLGTLTAGESVSVGLVVLVDVNHDGDVTNTATVDSSTPDPDPSDNSATAITTDDPAGVDLSLIKDADVDLVSVGDVVVYTIVVANAGPADATGVEVKDQLPDGLEFVSAHADRGAYDEDVEIWGIGDLPAGEDATLVLKTRVARGASGRITNRASVLGFDQTDATPANDEASADVEIDVLANQVEVVGPPDGLAYTGFDIGLAVKVTLGLLLVGAMLLVLGRRLERRTRPAA